MKTSLLETVKIPEKVVVQVVGGLLTVKGPKGEVQRKMQIPHVSVQVKDGLVVLDAKDASKREKKILFTIRAHLNNMIKGVQQNHVYKVKVCSGHFPMNVTVKGEEVVVKNFLGEKYPRTLKITKGADVKFADNLLTVTGCDLEKVSQMAAKMEQLTRITNKDRRVFQDGLYIIDKDGVEVE